MPAFWSVPVGEMTTWSSFIALIDLPLYLTWQLAVQDAVFLALGLDASDCSCRR